MKSCFGYIRVSTVKQGDGVSLEAQKEAILAFSIRHNITITQWFEEKETAAKRGRPVFNKMVADLRRRKAAGLVIHKIDRSARNLGDWARIGELADVGIDIHFATESLDFRSRGGRLAADVQAVVAADYVRNLREECIKGLNGRLKQGLYPFKAPIGYLDNGGGKAKTPDPERAHHIRNAFELYGSGRYSQCALMRDLNQRGLRKVNGNPLTPQNLELILGNPFYCGLIRIRKTGQIYQGCHEPLIPITLFERVQDVKAGKGIKKVTRHDHIYRRLFHCGHCTSTLVPELQKGRVYYRCQVRDCPTKTVREDAIEAAIRDCLARCQLTDAQFERLSRWIEVWSDGRQNLASANSLRMKLSATAERRERLTDALIDRLIDQEAFASRNQALMLDEARLKQEIQNLEELRPNPKELREFLELVKNLASAYDLAGRAEKQCIARIATSNRRVTGRTIGLEPSEWLTDMQLAADVKFGGPHRGTHRTFGGELGELAQKPQMVELISALSNSLGAPDRHQRKRQTRSGSLNHFT